VRCRECTSLLLDITAFYGAEDAGRTPTEAEAAEDDAVWEALRGRLPVPATRAARRPRLSFAPVWGWLGGLSLPARTAVASAALLLLVSVALAALLASAVGEKRELSARLSEEQEARRRLEPRAEGAEAWMADELREAHGSSLEERARLDEERARAEQLKAQVARLEAQLAEARRESVRPGRVGSGSAAGMWVNAPVLPLAMLRVRDGVRSPGDALTLELPAGTDLFTLAIQDPAPGKSYARYAIEIEDARGRQALSEDGLRIDSPDKGRWLTIALRKGRLPDGQYRITIFGIKGGERTEEGVRDIILKHK
jgi:hypothetical protein